MIRISEKVDTETLWSSGDLFKSTKIYMLYT